MLGGGDGALAVFEVASAMTINILARLIRAGVLIIAADLWIVIVIAVAVQGVCGVRISPHPLRFLFQLFLVKGWTTFVVLKPIFQNHTLPILRLPMMQVLLHLLAVHAVHFFVKFFDVLDILITNTPFCCIINHVLHLNNLIFKL